jgi:hypothetical protein
MTAHYLHYNSCRGPSLQTKYRVGTALPNVTLLKLASVISEKRDLIPRQATRLDAEFQATHKDLSSHNGQFEKQQV